MIEKLLVTVSLNKYHVKVLNDIKEAIKRKLNNSLFNNCSNSLVLGEFKSL